MLITIVNGTTYYLTIYHNILSWKVTNFIKFYLSLLKVLFIEIYFDDHRGKLTIFAKIHKSFVDLKPLLRFLIHLNYYDNTPTILQGTFIHASPIIFYYPSNAKHTEKLRIFLHFNFKISIFFSQMTLSQLV